PGGGGAFEGATVEKLLGGAPVVALVDDAAFGAGAGDGVALPAAAGGDPDDVGGVEGDGGDQDVIAVGHHDHVRVGAHRIAQDAFDLVDLPDAVELVAGEVEQHQAGRLQAGDGGGDVEFIDFEDHMGGFAPGEQRGDDAGVHVVTALIGGDGELPAHGGGQHAGGGGFAVGAGHQRDGAVAGEGGHDLRVDGVGHESTDHATGSATGDS